VLLDVADLPGERSVDVAPLPRSCPLVTAGREQRMREAHRLTIELDHACIKGVSEGFALRRVLGDGRDRRTGQCGSFEQHVGGRLRQPVQTLVEGLTEVRGEGPFAAARELEREERVASRRLVDPHEIGAREIHPGAIAQEPVHLAEPQRLHAHLDDAVLPEQRGGLERRSHAGRVADADEQRDELSTQSPQRQRQHARRGRVEPLQVVDRDDDASIG
jgi:hypothetical protein